MRSVRALNLLGECEDQSQRHHTERCTDCHCHRRAVQKARADGVGPGDVQTAEQNTADHGNADLARNADGSPHTAHTTNPVPIWVHGAHVDAVKDGILADVAPTVLHLMNLPQPADMTGRSLI